MSCLAVVDHFVDALKEQRVAPEPVVVHLAQLFPAPAECVAAFTFSAPRLDQRSYALEDLALSHGLRDSSTT